MKTSKSTARMIGVYFFVATAAYLTGSGLIDTALSEPDFLTRLYSDRANIYLGLFLELINCAAVVGIAALLYPVLKQHSESIALGYLSSRIVESLLLVVSIIGPLILLALSQEYMNKAGDDELLTIGNLIVTGQGMAFELSMLALGLGSIMFCYIMYRAKLVPRVLSLFGIVGYTALIVSSCLTMIGYEPGVVLFIPGGIFEIVFPLWLMIKGFNTR